jgi:PAS domain S-box-containing protein
VIDPALDFLRWGTTVCSIPVILLANAEDPETENAARAAGAVDYIPLAEFTQAAARRAVRYVIEHRKIDELQAAHQAAGRAVIESRKVAQSAITATVQLEAILNSLTDSVIVIDQQGVVQMANSFAVAMFGFDPLRMNRRAFTKRLVITNPEGQAFEQENLPSSRASKGEIVLNQPLTIQNPRGRTYEVLASAQPLYIGKEFLGVVLVLNDITEREQLRQQIEDDRSRLQTVIQNAPDGIILAGADLRILLSNPAAVDLLSDAVQVGRMLNTPERSLGHPLLQPDGQPFNPDSLPLVRAIREGKIFNGIEAQVSLASGEKRVLLINASPIKDNEDHITGGVALFRDITEMQDMQTALKESEAEQMMHRVKSILQRELDQQRERERTQIARDLHDGPLQELIATSFILVDAMTIDTKEERLTRMRSMQESLQKNIRDLRVFCNDLRPPVLASFGLEKTIRSHIENFRISHPEIRARAELMPDGKILPESESLVIFRAYQEAINNIVKHSRATDLRVSLLVHLNRVTLEIKDNGVGFNVPSDWVEVARSGHLGLIGMRERVESIGGTVVIRSRPNQGTRVEINVPIRPPLDESEG